MLPMQRNKFPDESKLEIFLFARIQNKPAKQIQLQSITLFEVIKLRELIGFV